MEDNDDYPYAITIYPEKDYDECPKTDPIGLINVAIERKDDYDELWVVFDKNGYTKHKESFELAKKNNINIAFSSIAFEIWVLLHFERSNDSFVKSANVISEKFHNNSKYIDDYAKSGDYSVFPKVQTKTIEAFKNASWLRNWLYSNNPKYSIYMVNPYTDVDALVKKLLLDEFIYEYREVGQNLIFDGVEMGVSIVNNEYVIKIRNLTSRSLVLNEFSFYDDLLNKINVANSILLAGHSVIIDLGQLASIQKVFVEFRNLKLEINGVVQA